MKDGKYEASDFVGPSNYRDIWHDHAAATANALLPELEKQLREKWLRDAPVVIGESIHGPWWENAASKKDTHTAFLVEIRRLASENSKRRKILQRR